MCHWLYLIGGRQVSKHNFIPSQAFKSRCYLNESKEIVMAASLKAQAQDNSAKASWYSYFPIPKAKPDRISCQELRSLLDDPSGRQAIVVVDVRRTDFEVHSILPSFLTCQGVKVPIAINIPAQSFPLNIPEWSRIFGDRVVIFYCSSSTGRGPRSASAYQDYLDATKSDGKAMILDGGIKGWHKSFPDLLQAIPDLQ